MGTYTLETRGASRSQQQAIIAEFLALSVSSSKFPRLMLETPDGQTHEICRHKRGKRLGPWTLSNARKYEVEIRQLLKNPGTVTVEHFSPRQRLLFR